MSKPIKVSYIWNRENLDRLFEESYRYMFNNSSKRYIGWLFIAIMQFGVVAALKKGSFALLLFSTIVLIYWYYGKKYIAKKRAIKAFENSEFKDKKIEMSIDEDGITILSNGNEKWKWEDIAEIVPLEDDIMIYKYPNFHYIPSNGFESLEEKSRFKSLAKKHQRLK
jgi:hypothetical protein